MQYEAIVAYDAATQRAFVVNGGDKTLDICDISDPTVPALVSQVNMTAFSRRWARAWTSTLAWLP